MTRPEDTCAAWSQQLGEPLAGTSPQVSFWVLLEQPGPWGRQAWGESHLDPLLGRAIERAIAEAGGRGLLVRRPGRHADAHSIDQPRTILVAGVGADGEPWLASGTTAHPEHLLNVDWSRLARPGAAPAALTAPDTAAATVRTGEPIVELSPHPEPLLAVCTNAKRDQCCAVLGRPLAHSVSQQGHQVWECSHTGGHRFAPTALVLPSGALYGRLDDTAAAVVLAEAAAGLVHAGALRGLSWLPAAEQVADAHLRAQHSAALPVHALQHSSSQQGDGVLVTSYGFDGQGYQHQVTFGPATAPRPESCGKAPGQPRTATINPGFPFPGITGSGISAHP